MDNNFKEIQVNDNQNFTFDGDELYRNTKLPEEVYGKDMYKFSLIMTKEVFQECYNRWIKPQVEKRVI